MRHHTQGYSLLILIGWPASPKVVGMVTVHAVAYGGYFNIRPYWVRDCRNLQYKYMWPPEGIKNKIFNCNQNVNLIKFISNFKISLQILRVFVIITLYYLELYSFYSIHIPLYPLLSCIYNLVLYREFIINWRSNNIVNSYFKILRNILPVGSDIFFNCKTNINF